MRARRLLGKVRYVGHNLRFFRVVTALACFAALTGCSQSEEAKPTLGEAVTQLVGDADRLLASAELKASGAATATEKAETDQSGACPPGEVQRFYRAQGELSGPSSRQSPHDAAALMRGALRNMGYEQIVDDLDVRDEKLSVVVLRKRQSGTTFVIAVRTATQPNILIIGKTDCLTA